MYIASIVNNLPTTSQKMDVIRINIESDNQLQSVLWFIRNGWPEYAADTPEAIKEYFQLRGGLSDFNGLVVRNKRIVTPTCMRKESPDRIHEGHQGLHRCRERAYQAVWWPNISRDIKQQVQECPYCIKTRATQ